MNPQTIIQKAEDCLQDATDLLGLKRYEAAVNRAYYSIFHCIQVLLWIENIQTKSHEGAHNQFRLKYIKTGIFPLDSNVWLQKSYEKRRFSDYDYDEIAPEEANESVENAQNFFTITHQFLSQNSHL